MALRVLLLAAPAIVAIASSSCHDDSPAKPAAIAPVLTTTAVSDVTQTTANSGGCVTSNGGAAVTARGVCWSTAASPTTADSRTNDGLGMGSYASHITGLTAGTTYHVRAFATNGAGTGYGDELVFATLQVDTTHVPVVTTRAISNLGQTTATSGGDVASDGGAPVTTRGVCWSTGEEPTIEDDRTTDGEGAGSFISSITGLIAGTGYHVRAYATNRVGTGYGNDVPFATLPEDPSTVIDMEGNVYKTVRIGTQLWMAENLRVTKFNNGESIPNVTDNAAWMALSGPGFCWYQNDYTTYGAVYGALYNWYAVDSASNGNRSICPVGWHIPTEDEWTVLTSYLGGLSVAGGKMKESGTAHWNAPNTGATNESGFTALPAGYRGYATGAFNFIGNFGHWWSRTSADQSLAWGEGLFYLDNAADNSTSVKRNGFSIRCIKD
jgi:uncharacterized protein (TIGR02145 family)